MQPPRALCSSTPVQCFRPRSYSLDRTFMENNAHCMKENQSSKLIVDPRDANELVYVYNRHEERPQKRAIGYR